MELVGWQHLKREGKEVIMIQTFKLDLVKGVLLLLPLSDRLQHSEDSVTIWGVGVGRWGGGGGGGEEKTNK